MISPEQSVPALDDHLGQGLDPRILTDLVALIPCTVDKDNFIWNKIRSPDDECELCTVYRRGMMTDPRLPSAGAESESPYPGTPAQLSPDSGGCLSVIISVLTSL